MIKSVRGMTSLFIERAEQRKTFHCSNCGKPLFAHYGNILNIIPGDASQKMKFPIELHCHGSHPNYGKCKAAYVIEGMTE